MIVNYSDSDSETDGSLSPTDNLFKRETLPRKIDELNQKQKNYLKISKHEKEASDDNEKLTSRDTPKKVGFLSSLPDPINKGNVNQPKSSIIRRRNDSPPSKKVTSENPYISEQTHASEVEEPIHSHEPQCCLHNADDSHPQESVKNLPETDWQEVINKTVGKKQSNIDIKDIQVVDLTDDDIVGDTSELFRCRIEPQNKLFQNKNIGKPTNVESSKHKVNYLAYQAQQQEMHKSAIWDYKPRKRSNREQYGF